MVDLQKLGERSILIDCDVLQADGGTRTASITGSCVALALALDKLAQSGKLSAAAISSVWLDTVAAISVGMKEGTTLVDLDYVEDSSCDVDMNFVITGKGGFVEVQGTGEQRAFSKSELDSMTSAAITATDQIRELQVQTLKSKLLALKIE
jgi:ribonuclease PH